VVTVTVEFLGSKGWEIGFEMELDEETFSKFFLPASPRYAAQCWADGYDTRITWSRALGLQS
jgi:hypothetical protein